MHKPQLFEGSGARRIPIEGRCDRESWNDWNLNIKVTVCPQGGFAFVPIMHASTTSPEFFLDAEAPLPHRTPFQMVDTQYDSQCFVLVHVTFTLSPNRLKADGLQIQLL
jgi:hypothetical protein